MVGDIIVAVVCGVLSIGLLIWAVLLFSGKGYRSIAGNNDASDKTITEQKKGHLGLGVGIILLIAAIMTGVQAITSILNLI